MLRYATSFKFDDISVAQLILVPPSDCDPRWLQSRQCDLDSTCGCRCLLHGPRRSRAQLFATEPHCRCHDGPVWCVKMRRGRDSIRYGWLTRASYLHQVPSLSVLASALHNQMLSRAHCSSPFVRYRLQSRRHPTNHAVDMGVVGVLQVQPTLFFGVPRVYEKIQERMLAFGERSNCLIKLIARWAKRKVRVVSERRACTWTPVL